MRLATPVFLALVLAPATFLDGSPQQQPPVFGAEVELVRIDVVVLGRDGKPVSGLSKQDFTVEEDGRPQAIESFEPVVVKGAPIEVAAPPRLSGSRLRPPSEGRSFFVFFDGRHVSQPAAEVFRKSLHDFVQDELREGDWFTLAAPEQALWWTARNGWEYRQLSAVIDRLKGEYVRDPLRLQMSDWEAMRIVELGVAGLAQPSIQSGGGGIPTEDSSQPGRPPSSGASGGSDRMGVGAVDKTFLAEEVYSRARRGLETTLVALRQALDSLVPLRGRKSLLLVSEGFVLVPDMPGYSELVDVARRANVAVHFLDPRGLDPLLDAEAGAPGLGAGTARMLEQAGADDVAAATGGHAIVSNDPAEGLRRIAAEAEAYYLLGYAPARKGFGERKVKVRTTRDGLSVRARSRFFVEDPAKAAARRAKEAKKDETSGRTPQEKEAMRSVADTTELPLRVSTLFFEDNGKGEVTTMYATEIRVPVSAAGKRKFATVAEARPRDGGKALRDEFEEELNVRPGAPTVLSRHWHMPPGVWQVRVLVRDRQTGAIGTALHTYEVPDPKSFRFATPILTTEMETVDGRERPRVVLARTFGSGRVLYCQYQVHGAKDSREERLPNVVAGWQLWKDGALVRAAEPTRIRPEWDGRLSRLLGITLTGLEPGEYELRLKAQDLVGGATAEIVEPFTLLL
jgi:VWFA-related protein